LNDGVFMGIKRYELSDRQCGLIAAMLPGKANDSGRMALDNRLFVNAVFWVLRSGARWSDPPERYGKYKSVHKRFTRWAAAGVWERIFTSLSRDRDNEYLVIDSAIVQAHAQAATGQKGGLRSSPWTLEGRADEQMAYRGRQLWATGALHSHRRQCQRSEVHHPTHDRTSCPDRAPSIPSSTNSETASNVPSDTSNNSAASQPDTTGCLPTISPVSTSLQSTSGAECRFNLGVQ
jgi:transposase